MKGIFANIIVDISHEKVDRPFQYRVPDELTGKLAVGMSVMIPFGKGNKLMEVSSGLQTFIKPEFARWRRLCEGS